MSILIKKISCSINQKPLSNEEIDGILSVSLNQYMSNHHNLSVSFRKDIFDKDTKLLEKTRDFLGKQIDVKIDIEETSHSLLFLGVITSVFQSRSNEYTGDLFVIHATSPGILLDDGSHCKSFSEKQTSDIVKELLANYKLPCKTEVSSLDDSSVKPYIVQYKETAFQFIKRLAAKYGQWFYYDGSKLVFGKLSKSKPVDLIYGKNLFDFSMGLKVEPFTFGLIAYDPHDEGAQVYESNDASQPADDELSPLSKVCYAASEDMFPNETKILYNHPLSKDNQQSHLDDRVKIKNSGKVSNLLIFSGESDVPSLSIGSVVNIVEKADNKQTNHGRFIICEIEHNTDRTLQYSNKFSAIPAECRISPDSSPHSFPFCETQSAIVKENVDPDNLGRVRVKFFWQNDEISPWIRIVNPYAGKDKGHLFVPEIDEEVLVAFESGNAEKPYVIGAMYHGLAKPESWKNDKNNIKAIRTRTGHTIEFDDTEGKEEIRIFDYKKENYSITLKTHTKEIIIEAIENIEIKAKNISILAEKELKIEATNMSEKAGGNKKTEVSGNYDTTANGNISIKASGNLSQNATTVKIN